MTLRSQIGKDGICPTCGQLDPIRARALSLESVREDAIESWLALYGDQLTSGARKALRALQRAPARVGEVGAGVCPKCGWMTLPQKRDNGIKFECVNCEYFGELVSLEEYDLTPESPAKEQSGEQNAAPQASALTGKSPKEPLDVPYEVGPAAAAPDAAAMYRRGFEDGIRAYAWYKDGVQEVGTTGTTLRKALADVEKTWNYSPPPPERP